MFRIVPAGLLPVLLAVPGAAVPPPARGEQAPPIESPSIVTEAEFLSALDDSHPAVAESAEALALARAQVVAASTFDDPVLGTAREDPSGPVGQTDWTLSWQPPGADRRPTIAAREEKVDAEAERLAQQLLALRLAMKEVYADWSFASVRMKLLSTQERRVRSLADRERLRVERGEASGLDVRRLDLAAGSLRARVALAAASTEQARSRAAGWFPGLPVNARPVVPKLPATPEVAESHPLLRAATKDLAAATMDREAAGRFVRFPEITLGWQRQEAGSASIDGPVFGLAWSVPLFGRNRAEKAASDARIAAANARLERVGRELDSARTGALASFQSLVAAVAAAEADANGNERLLAGTEAAFRLGEANLTDLLETHRSVTESELAVLDLREAALAAYRDLEGVTGD